MLEPQLEFEPYHFTMFFELYSFTNIIINFFAMVLHSWHILLVGPWFVCNLLCYCVILSSTLSTSCWDTAPTFPCLNFWDLYHCCLYFHSYSLAAFDCLQLVYSIVHCRLFQLNYFILIVLQFSSGTLWSLFGFLPFTAYVRQAIFI